MTSSACFVCSVPLSSISGLGADLKRACDTCKHRARLTPGNALLTTILHSSGSHPQEGSGLNAILSPVIIDGRRGWCDFAAGGYAVFKEVATSSDYFDFLAQHIEPWAGVLRSLQELPRAERVPDRVLNLLRRAPARFPGLDNLTILKDHWDYVQRVADTLAAHPPITSTEDAWRIADSIAGEHPPATPQSLSAMLDRMVRLSSGEGSRSGVHEIH